MIPPDLYWGQTQGGYNTAFVKMAESYSPSMASPSFGDLGWQEMGLVSLADPCHRRPPHHAPLRMLTSYNAAISSYSTHRRKAFVQP